MKRLALAVLAAISFAACTTPDTPEASIDTMQVTATPVVETAAQVVAQVDSTELMVSRLTAIIANNNIADAPLSDAEKDLGVESQARKEANEPCLRYNNAQESAYLWRALKNNQYGWDDKAREALGQNAKAVIKHFVDVGTVVCDSNWEPFDILSDAAQWLIDVDIAPSEIGLSSGALRTKLGHILACRIREKDEQLHSMRESPVPSQYLLYNFTQKEMGLSDKEWTRFMEKTPK